MGAEDGYGSTGEGSTALTIILVAGMIILAAAAVFAVSSSNNEPKSVENNQIICRLVDTQIVCPAITQR